MWPPGRHVAPGQVCGPRAVVRPPQILTWKQKAANLWKDNTNPARRGEAAGVGFSSCAPESPAGPQVWTWEDPVL